MPYARPITGTLQLALPPARCVQDACKRFSTKRRLTDHPTREDGADLGEHHQPESDNTGHHGPGSPLNLRVRGSSPWRRTTSDLALCDSNPRARAASEGQSVQMRAESERGSHALNPPRRNLRARGHAPVRDRRDGTAQRTTDRLSTADFSDLFAGYRGAMDPGSGAIADALNTRPKYVASNTITEPRWADPTILSGDLAAAIGAAVRNRRPGPKDVASECRPLRCPGQWPGASVHVAVPCSKTPGAVAPNQLASKRSQPAYQKVVENPKAVSDRRGDSS